MLQRVPDVYSMGPGGSLVMAKFPFLVPPRGFPVTFLLKCSLLALLCFWAMALGLLSPFPLGVVTLPFLTTCPLGHLPPLPKMGCGEGCVGPAVSKDNTSGLLPLKHLPKLIPESCEESTRTGGCSHAFQLCQALN